MMATLMDPRLLGSGIVLVRGKRYDEPRAVRYHG
jgi:hypothetical protein